MTPSMFSGSYSPDDVVFLLKPIQMAPVSLAEKERRIQTGESHYSQMIGEERLPSAEYLTVFNEGCLRNVAILARNVAQLARLIALEVRDEVTIVSLARAGTPVGVLLKRALLRYFHKKVNHFSISIIRDRGIDENALLYILREAGCPQESIVFVDGWTGKGVITRELKKAVAEFNLRHKASLSDKLYVLADLCGAADVAPSCEDYLIPSSILNATVSGLVSRSILNEDYIGPEDFHGCVYYREFEDHDLSNRFVDYVSDAITALDREDDVKTIKANPLPEARRRALRDGSAIFLRKAMELYGVKNVNYVKPGIGEATRVLLRREPDVLALKDPSHPDARHLIVLAKEKHVPVVVDESLPYQAAAFIRNLKF